MNRFLEERIEHSKRAKGCGKITPMQFNSLAFLIFLPVVFLLYWQVSNSRRWQNGLVVVASYVFYGWWDWRFLGLIAFTSLLSYGGGILTEHFNGRRRHQRTVYTVCIVVSLLILAVFKYFNFFADSLCTLLGLLGCQADWATLNVVLPVGISFYTFSGLELHHRCLSWPDGGKP